MPINELVRSLQNARLEAWEIRKPTTMYYRGKNILLTSESAGVRGPIDVMLQNCSILEH
jgi:hypothetical protein